MKSRKFDRKYALSLAIAAKLATFLVSAAEVAPNQAESAVGSWLRLGSRRLGEQFCSKNAKDVKTVRGSSGRAVYHAVNLEGGGFVVTSGDTRLPPVIAFSDKGGFTDDESSAFHALLEKTLSRAVDSFARSDHQVAAFSGEALKGDDSHSAAEAEWEELLASVDDRQVRVDGSRKAALSDMRVDKLLDTEWGQSGMSIWNWNPTLDDWEETYYPSFNYYVTNYYPCGCVATAGAQIMKYWRKPSGTVARFSTTCLVDGASVDTTSIAGAFNWDAMYLKWDSDDPIPSKKAREAVGKLTYNIAVAIGTEWGLGFGSASIDDLLTAMKEKFGYKSGNFVWYDLDVLDKKSTFTPDDIAARLRAFYYALYASLDAKMPVIMSIDGDYGGHAIVADGYGYTAGKRYTHLNFGWYGDDNAWYYLPDETLFVKEDNETYSVFEGLGFNIHPTETGDVVSGRVLGGNGNAVAGATVRLYDSSNALKATATSDSNGIYSFRVKETGNYTVTASHSSTEESPSKSVNMEYLSDDGSFSASRTEPWAGWSGNKWGVDLRFPVTIPSPSEPDPSDPVDPSDPADQPDEPPVDPPDDGESPESGGSGDDVDPESVDPFYPADVPCYKVIDPREIWNPIKMSRAMSLWGAVYYGCDVVGIVEIKLGKPKNGEVKVSGSVILFGGKKYSFKSKQKISVNGPFASSLNVDVKKIGMMSIAIGSMGGVNVFSGALRKYHVQTAAVGGAWKRSRAAVTVDADDVSMIPGAVFVKFLPNGEVASVSGDKWTFGNAAKIKLKNGVLEGADDPSKPNRSGIKLSYKSKTGIFKGSLKVYSSVNGKLKKYTFKVNGGVVDGVGYGKATCKKPAASWNLIVR